MLCVPCEENSENNPKGFPVALKRASGRRFRAGVGLSRDLIRSDDARYRQSGAWSDPCRSLRNILVDGVTQIRESPRWRHDRQCGHAASPDELLQGSGNLLRDRRCSSSCQAVASKLPRRFVPIRPKSRPGRSLPCACAGSHRQRRARLSGWEISHHPRCAGRAPSVRRRRKHLHCGNRQLVHSQLRFVAR